VIPDEQAAHDHGQGARHVQLRGQRVAPEHHGQGEEDLDLVVVDAAEQEVGQVAEGEADEDRQEAGKAAHRAPPRASVPGASHEVKGEPWEDRGKRRDAMAFTRPELERFAAKERDRFEDLLEDFVEIASVSADPAHKADVESCAELGAATLRALGRLEVETLRYDNRADPMSFDGKQYGWATAFWNSGARHGWFLSRTRILLIRPTLL